MSQNKGCSSASAGPRTPGETDGGKDRNCDRSIEKKASSIDAPNLNKGGVKNETSSKEKICTLPGGVQFRKPHERIPNLRRRILELLADGCTRPKVCEKLHISRSKLQYHVDWAKRHNVLAITNKRRKPLFYEKGPNWHYLESKWSGDFELYVRVHFAQGNLIKAKIDKVGDIEYTHTIIDGEKRYIDIFPSYDGKKSNYAMELDLPRDLIGREGAKAKVIYFPKAQTFNIYPASAIVTKDDWENKNIPLIDGLNHIRDFFEKAGWRFSSFEYEKRYHFAFDYKTVEELCPELLDGVPKLKRGDSEEDLSIYWDSSHGKKELETTWERIAKDILDRLVIANRTGW